MEKFYTENELQEALDLHEDYYSYAPGESYISTETTPTGDIISFYVGRMDAQGNALTGYDKNYPEKRGVAVKFDGGEFSIYTSATDYSEILQLATVEGFSRGIPPEDIYAPDYDESWME